MAIVALVVPFLGWVVGVVLVWLSGRGTTRDKLVGTVGGLSWLLAGLEMIMTERASVTLDTAGAGPPPDPTR